MYLCLNNDPVLFLGYVFSMSILILIVIERYVFFLIFLFHCKIAKIGNNKMNYFCVLILFLIWYVIFDNHNKLKNVIAMLCNLMI